MAFSEASEFPTKIIQANVAAAATTVLIPAFVAGNNDSGAKKVRGVLHGVTGATYSLQEVGGGAVVQSGVCGAVGAVVPIGPFTSPSGGLELAMVGAAADITLHVYE